ncbi:MAG: hypothetical protein HYX94_08910 [Chloroflexi bacterium]|nr:hypothetical protein [Chloroflexota bacterium]
MMDSDFGVNIREIIRNIDSSDVLTIYFPIIRKTLLVDTRADSVEGPLVRVVPMVNSVEERFRSLKKLRPQFPRPESITLVPWPKYIRSMESLGIWEKIVGRLARMGYPRAVEDCQRSLKELLDYEKLEHRAAIKGDGYQALWERSH